MARGISVPISGDPSGLKGALSEAESALGRFGRNASRLVGAAAVGAGAAVVGGLTVGVNQALGREQIFDRLNAQLGATGADAERFGQIAGDLYKAGWGTALADVADAVATTQQNLGDLIAAQDLEFITSRGIDFASVLGEDVATIQRTIGQLLRTEMADSAEEAFDLLAAGTAKGLNRADDLLDTLNEYAPSFSRLGIDADTAMGLLNAGLEQGAFNTDKIGDAFNEFSIRAIDGSTGTLEAFELLNVSADDFADRIAAGGDSARDATIEVLMGLREMEDQVEQDLAGVALFGSMWEDLGAEAILALDPMTATLGDVNGAAETLSTTLNDNLTVRFEVLKRRGMMALADVAERFVIPALERVADFADGVADAFREDGLGGALSFIGQAIRDAWPDIRDAATELLGKLGRWMIDTALPFIIEKAGEWGRAFWDWLVPATKRLIEKAGQALEKLIDWIENDAWGDIKEAIELWGPLFVDWVADVTPRIVRALAEITAAMSIWNTKHAIRLSLMLAEWAHVFVTFVKEQLTPRLMRALAVMMVMASEWFVTAGRDLLVGGLNRMMSTAGGINEWFRNLPDNLLALLSDADEWLIEVGEAMIDGIITGIKNEAANLGRSLIDAGLDAAKGLADVLIIRSPSRLFMEMGEMSALGYQLGFENVGLSGAVGSILPASTGPADAGVPYVIQLDGQTIAEGVARANTRAGGTIL